MASTPPPPEEPRYAPECYACPIGTASMTVQRIRPEATEHFFRAGKELVLAMRSLVDGLADLVHTMEERSERAAPIQHIPIRRA